MASHSTAHSHDVTPGALVSWRRERLVAAGFEREHAQRLAGDSRWDLHALLELVDRGCPPHLAERIVAPLED
jgi:hypothetical protein